MITADNTAPLELQHEDNEMDAWCFLASLVGRFIYNPQLRMDKMNMPQRPSMSIVIIQCSQDTKTALVT